MKKCGKTETHPARGRQSAWWVEGCERHFPALALPNRFERSTAEQPYSQPAAASSRVNVFWFQFSSRCGKMQDSKIYGFMCSSSSGLLPESTNPRSMAFHKWRETTL